MKKLAELLTGLIQRENPEMTDLQVRTIKFGLECLLGDLSKLLLYFIIFALFSLTKYFLIGVAFFCILKAVSGGYHEETYLRCLITSFLVYAAIVLIGTNAYMDIYVRVLVLSVSTIITWIYAPVDHPNKPIKSEERRKKLKYISVMITVLLGALSFLLGTYEAGTALMAIAINTLLLPIGKIVNDKRVVAKGKELIT